MCLILPATVTALDGERVEVELHGGSRTKVHHVLETTLGVGDHVLVDRGLVVRVIEPDEVKAILGIYEEIGQLLAEADR